MQLQYLTTDVFLLTLLLLLDLTDNGGWGFPLRAGDQHSCSLNVRYISHHVTHTHALSHHVTHTHSHTTSHTCTLTPCHSHHVTHTHTLSHHVTHTHSHTTSLTCTLTPRHSHTLSHHSQFKLLANLLRCAVQDLPKLPQFPCSYQLFLTKCLRVGVSTCSKTI